MNFFKKITKEVSRVVKQVKKEAGRAALKVGNVLGTLPIPALGGLASGAFNTAGALLADKSARKYLEAIPTATLDSLVRGAQLALNPSEALNSIVNTIGTAQEQFIPQIGKVPFRDLLTQTRSYLQTGGGIVNGIAGLASGGLDGAPVGIPGVSGTLGNGIVGGGQYAADAIARAPLALAGGGGGVDLPGIAPLASIVSGGGGRGSPTVRVLLNSAGALAGVSFRFQ